MAPSSEPTRTSFTLNADLGEVRHARQLVLQSATEAGFSEERCFDIQVASSEACANAVEHSPPESEVEFEVLLYSDRLEVQVEGRGQFELPAVAARERVHRGLGLPLMAKLSDHFALYSGPRGGTLVALTFYRPGFRDAHADDVTPPSIAELIEENEVVSAILESITDEVWFADTEKNFTLANAAAFGEFGVAASDAVPVGELVKTREFYRPDMSPRSVDEAPPLRALAGEVVRNQEEVVRTPATGELRYRLVNAAPVRDASGNIIGSVSTVRDITDRRRAEAAIEQQARLLDLSNEAIFAWDLETGIEYWNKGAERLYRFSADEAIGHVAHDLLRTIHPQPLDEVIAALKRDGEWMGELIHTTKDGRVFVVESRQQLVSGPGRRLVLETTRDISERERAEQALRDSEERFRTMVDAIPQLAWIANADGYIHWYNRRWYEYTGTTLEEMEGWGWQSVHDPEALPAVLASWRESIATGEPFDMEFPLRGADGRVPPLPDQSHAANGRRGKGSAVVRHQHRCQRAPGGRGSPPQERRERGGAPHFHWEAEALRETKAVAGASGRRHPSGGDSRRRGPARLANSLPRYPRRGRGFGKRRGRDRRRSYHRHSRRLGRGSGLFCVHHRPRQLGGLVGHRRVVLLWTLAAAIAGFAADWVRHNALQREGLLARMLTDRATLSGSLAAVNTRLAARNEDLALREQELREAHAETARLLEEQTLLFRRLQESLLDIPRELSGVKFGHLYRSATQQAQVGGDFYDVFEAKEGRVGVLIGDVSGHGLEAARIATLVKDTVHAFAHQFRRPHLVLRETNLLLVEKKLPGFVTVFIGFLDPETGGLTYSSAGHPPPLLAADGRVEPLTSTSLPLGVFDHARYRDAETHVPEGGLLLFYTDGITEARRTLDFFGEARLADALLRACKRPVDEVPSCLLREALDFSSGALADDVALLAVSYLGKTVSSGR